MLHVNKGPERCEDECRAAADRIEQDGKRVVRVSVKNPLPDGLFVDHETIWRAAGGARSEVAKIGGITGLAEYFPRIRKAYLIGEAAPEFAATLGAHAPHEISANARCRGGQRGARRGGFRTCRSRGAAVAGLRVVRPVPQFRNPRRQVPRPRQALPGVKPAV